MLTPAQHVRNMMAIGGMLCFVMSMVLPDLPGTFWFSVGMLHIVAIEKIPLA